MKKKVQQQLLANIRDAIYSGVPLDVSDNDNWVRIEKKYDSTTGIFTCQINDKEVKFVVDLLEVKE